jgi:hypothetical protein
MDGLKVTGNSTTKSDATTRRTAIGRIAGGTLAAALATGAGTLGRSAAAAGTPTTGSTACGDPTVGTAVSFVSVEGAEVGKITVVKVTDPFTGYRPTSPPARGNRFIVLSVNVNNTGANPWQFDPGRIFLQDADGFVTYPSGVDLGDKPEEPALNGQTIAPGGTAVGVIGYTMLKGVAPIRIHFSPGSDRLLLLADLR